MKKKKKDTHKIFGLSPGALRTIWLYYSLKLLEILT